MVNDGHELEVHAEKAGDQVQRQKNRGQRGQGAHDVVGAVALRAEMNLHHGFGRLLEPPGVVHHALDVLDDVACPCNQLVAQRLRKLRVGGEGGGGLLAQGIEPFLHGVVLLLAQVFQHMQLTARPHQQAPVDGARCGLEQLALQVLELAGQLLPHVKVAVHHHIDHAQREVGRAGRNAAARGGRVHAEFGVAQKALDKVFGSVAAAHVHADQQAVKHQKPDGSGGDAVKVRRGVAALGSGAGIRVAVVRADGVVVVLFGFDLDLRGQPPENDQVVNRGVVVVGRVQGIGQILAVQVQNGRTPELLRRLLQVRAVRFKLFAVQKHPYKTIWWRLRGQRVGKTHAVAGKFYDLHCLGPFFRSNTLVVQVFIACCAI